MNLQAESYSKTAFGSWTANVFGDLRAIVMAEELPSVPNKFFPKLAFLVEPGFEQES